MLEGLICRFLAKQARLIASCVLPFLARPDSLLMSIAVIQWENDEQMCMVMQSSLLEYRRDRTMRMLSYYFVLKPRYDKTLDAA